MVCTIFFITIFQLNNNSYLTIDQLTQLISSFINAICFKVKVGNNELSLLNTVILIQTFSEPKWKVKEAGEARTIKDFSPN